MDYNSSNINSDHLTPNMELSSAMTNLTAAAPISSQVVDDFQPDAKWEFTPLEKASLECIELDAAPYETEHNDQQLDQCAGSLSHKKDDPAAFEQVEINTSTNLHTQDYPNEETKLHQDTLKLSENPVDNQTTVALDTFVDHEPQNVVEIQTTLPSMAKETEQSTPCGSTSTKADCQPGTSNQRTAGGDEQDDPIKEDIHIASNNFSNQASVDAQMETVIDNVVELGGGHSFGQDFSRAEDKAKVLESIHREITSDRSSMEIMADIALQQLPLLTETVNAPSAKPASIPIVPQEAPEKTEKLNQIDAETKPDLNAGSLDPQETDVKLTPVGDSDQEIITQEVVISENIDSNEHQSEQSIVNEVISVNDKTNTEETIETLVHEPAEITRDQLHEEQSNEQESADVESQSINQVANPERSETMVQPTETVEETQQDKVDSSPLVEEVTSVEERQDPDTMNLPTSMNKEITQENPSVSESVEEIDSEHASVSGPGRRRSGRARTKVEDKTRDSVEVETPRKASGRTRVSRESRVEVQPKEAEVEESQGEDVDAAQDTAPQTEVVAEENGEEAEVSESRAPLDNEVASKSARPVRARVSKKFEVEESMSYEEPKIKKASKRSRVALEGDLNKSYDASKSTPLIKLPTQRSRATISTSNPSTRPTPNPSKRKRSSSPEMDESFGLMEKKFACCGCNFSSDRLNNLVFHYTKAYCPGRSRMHEVMKADIIKQQQTPKGNKNKRVAR